MESDLWLRNARHANAMASQLHDAVKGRDDVTVSYPVQANAVFVRLPAPVLVQLHEQFHFYDWDEEAGEARWMTTWDTTPRTSRTWQTLWPPSPTGDPLIRERCARPPGSTRTTRPG